MNCVNHFQEITFVSGFEFEHKMGEKFIYNYFVIIRKID